MAEDEISALRGLIKEGQQRSESASEKMLTAMASMPIAIADALKPYLRNGTKEAANHPGLLIAMMSSIMFGLMAPMYMWVNSMDNDIDQQELVSDNNSAIDLTAHSQITALQAQIININQALLRHETLMSRDDTREARDVKTMTENAIRIQMLERRGTDNGGT